MSDPAPLCRLDDIPDRGSNGFYTDGADGRLLYMVIRRGNEVFARRSVKAAWTMVAGTCLFCGSIYAWTFGGPLWLVHLTPFGGVTLIAAWFLTAWAGLGLTRGGDSGNMAT